ncbi:protein yellow-like [Ctenocephalides felis]|uniref:protein yellow-like n=1 Tax=Ctenocephalides felis TaxID=7515 RepID=UPI000E6E148B|nr:protein yellow-like [Ctenocephalides felis]
MRQGQVCSGWEEMLMLKFIIIAALLCATQAAKLPCFEKPVECAKPLHPLLQWLGGSFAWPCPSTKAIYKSSGRFIPSNVIATRAQILRDEIFVALPRFKPGVPVTLGKTSLKKGCAATFAPFPCWSMQEEGNCNALQSVVDVFLDRQEILWALDTGVTETLENPIRRCPPKVVAFDTKTGKALKTIDLSPLTSENSRLQYFGVEYSPDGRVFLYVSDAATRAILVYDVQANKGFRVVLPKQVINGCSRKDVLYIALVTKDCGTNYLYFTYLSSLRMFAIRTDYLRQGCAQGRIQDLGPKPTKIVILGTDGGSAIFFRHEGHSNVYRWDTNTEFLPKNFKIVYRGDNCHLATHAMPDLKHQKMRVLESNFPDFIQGTVGCGASQQLSALQGCW